MDYQDIDHYSRANETYDWRHTAESLFKRFDNVAAVIAQWDNSEISATDALVRIQTIVKE